MFTAPELLIEGRLRAGLAQIAADPELLNDAIGRFDDEGQREIKRFFAGVAIPVLDGYPLLAAHVPCIAVTLRPEQETGGPINDVGFHAIGEVGIVEHGYMARATVSCRCYGNVQREATIIGLAAKLILLSSRLYLHDRGLFEQALTVSEEQPEPSAFDELTPWFVREVAISAAVIDSVTEEAGTLIAAINVDPYDDRVSAGLGAGV